MPEPGRSFSTLLKLWPRVYISFSRFASKRYVHNSLSLCTCAYSHICKTPRTPVSHYTSQLEANQQNCAFEKKI